MSSILFRYFENNTIAAKYWNRNAVEMSTWKDFIDILLMRIGMKIKMIDYD